MDAIKALNLGLRFLLELAALVAFGYWGFKSGAGTTAGLVLGLGVPLLVAVIWAIFVAPTAPLRPPDAVRNVLGTIILLISALALAAAGASAAALVYGIVVIINAVLLLLWQQ